DLDPQNTALQRITDQYQGLDSNGQRVFLPRNELSEAIARCLMAELATTWQPDEEGKMFGILLTEKAGNYWVLKAFSGLWRGQTVWPGWVPPVPGREKIALAEQETLQQLDKIKAQLFDLAHSSIDKKYQILDQVFQAQAAEINHQLRQRKQERQQLRQQLEGELLNNQLDPLLTFLTHQSQQDGLRKRHWKQERDTQLKPLLQQCQQQQTQQHNLKQQRKQLSQQLTEQFHAAYSLTNFTGRSASLRSLLDQVSTGTGECCAPKLLHYAATNGFKPLSMAEFWWGTETNDKISGNFYGACAERCQPLMGFMLSGLGDDFSVKTINQTQENFHYLSAINLKILYEDERLIAVDKPSGLLSVPGRSVSNQISVVTILQAQRSCQLWPIHRLDQDTSGILVLVKDLACYQFYQQQFATKQVKKRYEALLSRSITYRRGFIDLPLAADLNCRPYQTVDWQRGKPSLTQYEVLTVTAE
ncbi:MAG: pseudouridine synthase, partial [Synechocystis sp.]